MAGRWRAIVTPLVPGTHRSQRPSFFPQASEDNDASQITYGPLAAFNPDREFVPVLVKESPSLDNGSLAQEGTAATSRSDQSIMRIDKLDD
jgi:hypothetical protein